MMKNTWKQSVFGLTVMITTPLALADVMVGEDATIKEAATWLTLESEDFKSANLSGSF